MRADQMTLNARNFLILGMIAGLVAGIFTFAVGNVFGEPHVETAIELEESGASALPLLGHGKGVGGELATHGDEDGLTVEVSRSNQRTFGLLTATVAIGVALGGLVALVSAALVGRIGRLRPSQTVGLVTLVGYVSVSFIPFVKYPSTPPAVGSGDTIGHRTGVYFAFLFVSLIAAVIAVYVGHQLSGSMGVFTTIVLASALYLGVMLIAGELFSTVNELGDFPADVLWSFRVSSLATITTMWATIGIVLAGLIGRRTRQLDADVARKDFAASL